MPARHFAASRASGDIRERWPTRACDALAVSDGSLVVAATFDPPHAREQYERWRAINSDLLDELPDDDIRIDTGRADTGGDFLRVWLPADAASSARFGAHS
jgi:hypothetical protein